MGLLRLKLSGWHGELDLRLKYGGGLGLKGVWDWRMFGIGGVLWCVRQSPTIPQLVFEPWSFCVFLSPVCFFSTDNVF